MNYSPQEIIETIQMVRTEHLDIRTVTMGISLLDCAAADTETLCGRIYEKILASAGRLVPVCETIEKELGIPIVHKRIAVTPIALLGGGIPPEGFSAVARTLDKAAAVAGVNFIGGFSALVHKGFTRGDRGLINALPEALAGTERLCASVNLATSKAGINMDAVAMMGRIIRRTAELTAHQGSVGCAKLVVFCNVPEDNPFMAGAFHGIGEPETVINVGVSGPGVVLNAVQKCPSADFRQLAEIIKKTAFKVTRMGELVGRMASERLDTRFGIVDLSLAPTPAVGDSIAAILEEMGIQTCGAPGTTAALALLNDAVKKGGAMASSSVGGLSGAFIPVSEDAQMIAAVEAGAMSLEKLEAMTCVCSVGIDMVAVPGDTPVETLSALIADEMAIGMINRKTTAVRIIPVIGKKAGQRVEFGGLLGTAPVMAISRLDSSRFVGRGGQIPPPIASLTN
ncbi:MAG: PFL family protein [Deltaproteobacteria bacterium]|nr:PFL family protein [Deltaproteobacteria bacterium]